MEGREPFMVLGINVRSSCYKQLHGRRLALRSSGTKRSCATRVGRLEGSTQVQQGAEHIESTPLRCDVEGSCANRRIQCIYKLWSTSCDPAQLIRVIPTRSAEEVHPLPAHLSQMLFSLMPLNCLDWTSSFNPSLYIKTW
jgi:hypothetical protein